MKGGSLPLASAPIAMGDRLCPGGATGPRFRSAMGKGFGSSATPSPKKRETKSTSKTFPLYGRYWFFLLGAAPGTPAAGL